MAIFLTRGFKLYSFTQQHPHVSTDASTSAAIKHGKLIYGMKKAETNPMMRTKIVIPIPFPALSSSSIIVVFSPITSFGSCDSTSGALIATATAIGVELFLYVHVSCMLLISPTFPSHTIVPALYSIIRSRLKKTDNH